LKAASSKTLGVQLQPYNENGPASAATDPDRGSDNPSQGKPNMESNITHALRQAMASCDDVDHLIHAVWMAARSMKGDEIAAGEAIEAVAHLAGERLQDVRFALRKAGAA
jgi:hypothetical protein